MATTTTTTLGTSNLRSTSRQQTRINPVRTSRTTRPDLRQNSLISNAPSLPPVAPEPHGFYPAISHFTDAVSALPRDYRRHASLLKEVDAKAWLPEESLHTLLSQCLTERQTRPVSSAAQTVAGSSINTADDAITLSSTNSVNGATFDAMSQYSAGSADPTLLQRRQMYAALRHNLMQMMITMDERNHVINNANEDLSKHIRRLDGIWPHIADEISDEARLGSLKHWAYTETNPTTKKVPATSSRREAAASLATLAENDIAHRSESRREAMLAKKQRLNQHVDSDFDEKAARKAVTNTKSRKTGETIAEPPALVVPNPIIGKRKKPEKTVGGVGMERSLSGARVGGVTMSRENSQQDNNTKKRKAPIAATTVARKRLNANAGESPKLASSPLANVDGKHAVKRSPALSTVRPAISRGRQNSNQSESLRARPSSSTVRNTNGNNITVNVSEMNTVVAATGRTATEVKNTMKESTNSKGDKLIQDDRPVNGENLMRGGLLLERTASKQSNLKREANIEEKRISSPRIPPALTAQEFKVVRGRASKTSTPVVSTFAEAEVEDFLNGNASENGNAHSKPKRAPRPRMKDHHGLHDSLSPKGLPMKRTHAKNASFSSLNALQPITGKPTSSRARDRDRNNDNEEATSRSTSRNNMTTNQATSQAHTSTSGSSISNPATQDQDIQLSEEEEEDEAEDSPVEADADVEVDPANDEEEDELRYCYCNGVSYGEMVACDNKNCTKEWFHLDCIGLKSLPKSAKWYCDECKKKLKVY